MLVSEHKNHMISQLKSGHTRKWNRGNSLTAFFVHDTSELSVSHTSLLTPNINNSLFNIKDNNSQRDKTCAHGQLA